MDSAVLTTELREQFDTFTAGKWDQATLESHQTRKLRDTVAHVRHNSPFYRERLAGLTPEAIAALTVDDLADLPFTTKEDLRNAQFDILSRPVSEAWVFYETTGTTGAATPCPRTNTDSINNNSVLTSYYGDVLEPHAHGRVVGISGPSELHATGDTFGDVCRNLGYTVAKMWPHSPVVGFDRALEVMRLLPMTALFCTPGMAMRLAQKAIDAGLRPRIDFPLDLLLLTGELMSPSLLDNISLLWDAEVRNVLYASQEASVLAAATSDGALRTAPLINLYEVVDPDTLAAAVPDANGVRHGELVVTNLYLGAKPLIRYRTGDLVRMHPPGAGAAVPAPALEVVGRVHDRLLLNGRLVNGYDLENLLLSQVRGYRDYQITVDRDDSGADRLSLLLRADPANDRPTLERTVQLCREELGTGLNIRFGVPGEVTGTGAMVSWKAARVVDLRAQRSSEDEAADRVAAARL
ncbi:phenylacetate--CoA ligase family protein [Lentzea sp. HUAS12]|uniref:phenylacetate--CoA ligase family protein n=1 Tax=Lentzea sp. HUAS12 TaxID=2951806 RepID=UPI00209F3F20|nr:phenylacetate--CoA ligase family protein [Lentzea sp. HUAS12]USX56280.1 phenylacetate--CoA ligase family protein [Lentzea sp. HUAS12]